jgi:hypothetical protein
MEQQKILANHISNVYKLTVICIAINNSFCLYIHNILQSFQSVSMQDLHQCFLPLSPFKWQTFSLCGNGSERICVRPPVSPRGGRQEQICVTFLEQPDII